MGSTKFANDIRHLSSALAAGRLAVLCGAGISAPPPASLPLARDLVRQSIARLLHPYGPQLPPLTLRPEMLFSYMYNKNSTATLDTIEQLLSASSYNIIHDFCAQVLGCGGAVVSTNFDLAIECAAAARGIHYQRSTSNCRSPDASLFKIHGSLDDRSSIGLTIDQVGAGLGSTRSKSLERLLRGRTVLVLGYSGNDQLDIMPALRATPYTRIVWIDHASIGRWHEITRSGSVLNLLPRSNFWRGPTTEVVRALAPQCLVTGACGLLPASAALHTPSLSSADARDAVIELLMHENRYEEIVRFIDSLRPSSDLRLRIRRFEAESSISRRPADWATQRDQFLDYLFGAPVDVQIEFLPTMAKYNHRRDRLHSLHKLERRALRSDAASAQHVEAAIETLYELIYNHLLADAKSLASSIERALGRNPNLVLQGRLAIERGYLAAQTYTLVAPDPALLRSGITACEEAKFLFSPEICNDAFFFNQARSNLGWIRCLAGEFGVAERELSSARRYFKNLSYNNYLTQWILLAKMRRLQGKFVQARRLLASFTRINRQSGRQYWLSFACREDAINAAALNASRTLICKKLQAANRFFLEEENDAEVELTRRVEKRLLSTAKLPESLLLRPAGAAWS